MAADHSSGWEAVADQYMALRSEIGGAFVGSWAIEHLPPSASILDLGCGSGMPIAQALTREGFEVWGVDASPTLLSAYRRHFPDMPAACEPVQTSRFFDRTFAGAVSIGLVFLLDADDQQMLLHAVAKALEPGGRFLFTAPREACVWRDTLTGRTSMSLGTAAYAAHLASVGLRLVDCQCDEGGNDYHDVAKPI